MASPVGIVSAVAAGRRATRSISIPRSNLRISTVTTTMRAIPANHSDYRGRVPLPAYGIEEEEFRFFALADSILLGDADVLTKSRMLRPDTARSLPSARFVNAAHLVRSATKRVRRPGDDGGLGR